MMKSDKDIAALAVRQKSVEVLLKGFQMLSKSDLMSDPRDLVTVLTLYYDSAKRIGLNPDLFFIEISEREQNSILAKSLVDFTKRKPEDKRLESSGYKAVNIPEFFYKWET